jgi:hypothetical protein
MKRSRVALLSLIATVILSACMSTGIVPQGRDTYMLSKQGTALSSGATVKASLYKEADAWCRKQNLVMVPVSERTTDGVPGVHFASAEITFRAVRSDDPENQRTNMKPTPNQVIEVR